jgi:hypothetical protein
MNSESFYVDANNSYAEVARFFNMSTVSASPNSCYVQTPIQNNLHPSSCYNFDNSQHVYSNSHASAALEVYIPMNNMMNSVNQYEAPNVINFYNMQNNVSPFYSSANNLQFFTSPSHMPMDSAAGYGTTSYLANCFEPSYITPYVTNFSAPYASPDNLNSAIHLNNAYSRISKNSIGAHVPLCNTIACDTPSKQLHNFGNTQVSLPKNIERSEGRSSKEWAEDLVEKVLEDIAMRASHGKKVDSISTVNPAKARLDNTCAQSNQ